MYYCPTCTNGYTAINMSSVASCHYMCNLYPIYTYKYMKLLVDYTCRLFVNITVMSAKFRVEYVERKLVHDKPSVV